MNKISKICLAIVLVIALAMCSTTSMAVEYGATMKLTNATTNANVNDTISVTLSLESVTNVQGVATVHAKINYDKAVLQYVSCEALNSWSAPIYNSDNQEFVTERADVMGAGQNIIKINFKVLSVPTDNKTTISITEFDVADTENQINVNDVSTTININKNVDDDNNDNNDNNDDNTQAGNNQNNTNIAGEDEINISNNAGINKNQDNTIANKIIPKAGISNIILIVVIVNLIILIAGYYQYKKMKDIK